MPVQSLKNQKQFDLVNRFGRKLNSRNFLLVIANNAYFLPKAVSGVVFFGMKVSKKLSKKAVVRNKIKRRIRHLVRIVLRQLYQFNFPSMALIIIPKIGFESKPFQSLQREFYQCLRKAPYLDL